MQGFEVSKFRGVSSTCAAGIYLFIYLFCRKIPNSARVTPIEDGLQSVTSKCRGLGTVGGRNDKTRKRKLRGKPHGPCLQNKK